MVANLEIKLCGQRFEVITHF